MEFPGREVLIKTLYGKTFKGKVTSFDSDFVVLERQNKLFTAIRKATIEYITDFSSEGSDHDVPGRGDLTPEGDTPGGAGTPRQVYPESTITFELVKK